MKTKLVLIAALALVLSGCTSTSKVIKALEKDRASFKLRVTTIYGNIDIQRVNPGAGHSASLSPDGLMKVEWVGQTNWVAGPIPMPSRMSNPPVPVTLTPEVRRAIEEFFGQPHPLEITIPPTNSAP